MSCPAPERRAARGSGPGRPGLGLVLILALGATGGPVRAQTAGAHRGLFVGMFTTTPGLNFMLQLDASNAPTSVATRPGSGPWPYWGNPFGMAVDVDNHHVIVPGLVDAGAARFALALWDPSARRVTGTLWTGARNAASVANWSNWTVNPDGDPVTIDNAGATPRLVAFERFAGAWKATPLPAGTPAFAGLGGLEWDPLEGGYVHVAWGLAGRSPSVLLRTAYDGSATRTLARAAGNLDRFGGTLLQNGDWIAASGGAYRYHVVRRGSTRFVPGPAAAGTTYTDVTREKLAAPGRGFYAAWGEGARGIAYVDAARATQVVVYTGTAATMPSTPTEVTPLFDRDLATVRTGKARWAVRVRPGAGALAGKVYLVAASLLPARPPVRLADGREIFIGFDGLLLMSIRGSVPPFLTGNLGVLDAAGRGRATLDFGTLGVKANGVVIHLAAVVLDRAAPAGVAWVCDPEAFVVNVLP